MVNINGPRTDISGKRPLGNVLIEKKYSENSSLHLTAKLLLREKCPHSEFFLSVFSPIRTRKIPNTDTFYTVCTKLNVDPENLSNCGFCFIIYWSHFRTVSVSR